MRIVSLLASATEIVCALGAGDQLVGRSHECDNPERVRSLPPCSEPAFDISGSSREIDAEVKRRFRAAEPLYRIHTERIKNLRPDLVIAQEHCEVCAVTPADVERSGCDLGNARVLSLNASTLDQIFESIHQIAAAIRREREAVDVIRRERERLEAVRTASARRRRPTVAMLEWTYPIFEMSNWIPELVEIANGHLLTGKLEDAEFLIVAPCGFTLERALEDVPVMQQYEWWNELQSVRTGNVFFADGNQYFNRSGMTIAPTAELIAEILHTEAPGGPSYRRLSAARN
jgi:iron complex transport system substrate-binding protein